MVELKCLSGCPFLGALGFYVMDWVFQKLLYLLLQIKNVPSPSFQPLIYITFTKHSVGVGVGVLLELQVTAKKNSPLKVK